MSFIAGVYTYREFVIVFLFASTVQQNDSDRTKTQVVRVLFCHFGLVSFMGFVTEHWHSCHVLFLYFECARAVRFLVCVPCFVLEHGVRIPDLIV